MNNDLINRSELKKAINKVVDEEIGIDEKWAKGLKYSLKIIDNAPTVNTKNCEGCPYCPNSNGGIPIGVE